MPNGSSRWNGNYGDTEKARREAYGKIAHAEKIGGGAAARAQQGERALAVSDTVPRDVVKPIPSEDVKKPPNRPPT